MEWKSREARREEGRAARQRVGRKDHDTLKTKARAESAAEILERSVRGRVESLIPRKRELMAASPFGYFRGAVPVMAADFAQLPHTGLMSQLCGDAHVRNLGAYAASDGRLVFDLNDFDETLCAPFEWDVKRMATSLMLAGRESGHKDASAQDATAQCAASYVRLMRELAELTMLEVARYSIHRIDAAKPIHLALRKAERATPMQTLAQLTEETPKGRRFRQIEPTLFRVDAKTEKQVLASLDAYRKTLAPERLHLLDFYRPVDVAFKVVGTGSVGLRDYCVFCEGDGGTDPLFLQIKEEPASGWTAALPEAEAAQHNGRRVAEGQRALQVESDPLLGWTSIEGRDYLVRQLSDHKASIELEDMAGEALGAYAGVCGELLARGHARSGDPVLLAGYLGDGEGFAEAIARFGVAYADQTELDWKAWKKRT